MYDVRCTIWKFARVARDAEREQGDVMKPCAGVVRKGRGRLTPPMYYDVRLRSLRALRGNSPLSDFIQVRLP